jgi:histone acetyltransferase MYST1
VFEIDGGKERLYCENLCYIAKMFLDHKTLEFDCTVFLYYVVCEVTERGSVIVGYFSKEKVSMCKYNLACILALPCHQRKGYGKFIISLSYELSKLEEKIGSPEKPISDLGKVSYLSYWSKVITDILEHRLIAMGDENEEEECVSIEQLARMTSITSADIVETLKWLKVLQWRGRWAMSLTKLKQVLEERRKMQVKQKAAIAARPDARNRIFVHPCRPEKLHWTPFLASLKKRDKPSSSR